MLFRRHIRDYRTKFVISSARAEKSLIEGITDGEIVKQILNRHYESEILDSAPYHYVITKAGYVELKSTDLGHSDKSFLKAYNEDIRILLADKDSLEHRIEFISDAIALASAKHSMPIWGAIIYSEYEVNRDEEFALKEIAMRAIKKRNKLRPIMCIYEHVIDDEVIVNPNIFPLSNRNGHTKLKFIANKYSIPLSSLRQLNGHVNEDSLNFTDTIFLPNTIAMSAKISILNSKKEAEFIIDRCNFEITEEVGLVG